MTHQAIDAIRASALIGDDMQTGRDRTFVRSGNAGEAWNQTRACLQVHAFRITLHAAVERGVHEHLDETIDTYNLRGLPPVLFKWRNQRYQHHQAGIHCHTGDFGGTAHAFGTAGAIETQISIQTSTQFVAVQHERVAMSLAQLRGKGTGQGGLARAGQPGKPITERGSRMRTGSGSGSP